MKKFTLLLLVSASLFYFAACGDSKKDDSPATDSDTAPADDSDQLSPSDDEQENDGDPDDVDDTPDPDAAEPQDSDPVSDDEPELDDGCVELDVPTITSAGYYDEINGFFSPAMGDSTVDIVKIFLMDTNPQTEEYDIEPGTYDLGSYPNSAYATCLQCVMVWIDVALGEPAEAYFQTEGSLTVTAVAGGDRDTRTDGYIENVKLVKAEFPDFTPIPEAAGCIRIPYADWSLTSTVAVPDSDVMPDEDSEPLPAPDAEPDAEPDTDASENDTDSEPDE
ncbi:hypothetical protein IKR20_05190 [bacterium]|nr:hypothetical protein [bacterium]